MVFLVEFERSFIFKGFERIFESDFNDFIEFKSDKNVDFSMFCRTHYRTRKWGFRRGNNRYALPGFRLLALKCKPRPHHGIKSYYNSTVLWYLLSDPLSDLLQLIRCNSPVCYSVK